VTVLLGIDAGFAELGWAVLRDGILEATGRIRTAKGNRKRGLHSGSDDARRIDEVRRALLVVLDTWAPDAVGYELPSGSQRARQAQSLGFAHAIVRCIVRDWDDTMPLLEVTVLDARRSVCGSAKPTEATTHDILRGRWGGLAGRSPHELDAVAVAVCASGSDVVRMLARRAG
jgi:Holliday junction resolvasome RuvABC endonuclease subunit